MGFRVFCSATFLKTTLWLLKFLFEIAFLAQQGDLFLAYPV